jgi:FtsZ-interacting cell division protein ZipA
MLQLLVCVIGFIAIVGFVFHGFWCGRQERSPLIRDEQIEDNANSMHPTTNNGTSNQKITIVDNDFADEDTSNSINGNKDTMYINSEEVKDDDSSHDETAVEVKENIQRKSFWQSVKNFFGGNANTQETSDIKDPENNYKIRITAQDGELFSAKNIVQLCQKYKLIFGKHDIYYHYKDDKEIFRLCGGEKPFVFEPSSVENLSFSSIILIMVLPDRGEAEDNYLLMAQFSYLLAKNLNGSMTDAHKEVLDQDKIESIKQVLKNYDSLS